MSIILLFEQKVELQWYPLIQLIRGDIFYDKHIHATCI